ncbi:putative transposase [Orientia tsutsugamushi str. UT76]|nr:putative transposase [Orientia tsutsugamushi str. UT76]
MNYEVVLIDATESPIERHKKNKNLLFRKKKRHTLKTQIVVDKKTRQVICTDFLTVKNMTLDYLRNPKFLSILRLK